MYPLRSDILPADARGGGTRCGMVDSASGGAARGDATVHRDNDGILL